MKKFTSIKEAATITGLTDYYIRNGCKNGTIPHIKSGRKTCIDMDAFLQQLNNEMYSGRENKEAQSMQQVTKDMKDVQKLNNEEQDMQKLCKQVQKKVKKFNLGPPDKTNIRIIDEDGNQIGVAFGIHALDEMMGFSNKKLGKLFIAILNYAKSGMIPDFGDDPALAAAWERMRPDAEMTKDEIFEYWMAYEDRE